VPAGQLDAAGIRVGHAVTVTVRAEDVRLAAAPSPGTLSATVTRLTLQGGHVLVGLEAPAPLEALVPAGQLDAAGIRVGHAVTVTVRAEDVHVLPPLDRGLTAAGE
jgi:ABC-type molybdate transport system ATPase subunit